MSFDFQDFAGPIDPPAPPVRLVVTPALAASLPYIEAAALLMLENWLYLKTSKPMANGSQRRYVFNARTGLVLTHQPTRERAAAAVWQKLGFPECYTVPRMREMPVSEVNTIYFHFGLQPPPPAVE